MFNSEIDPYSRDYRHQEEYDEEQQSLDEIVHKIAATIGRAAFDSCEISLELEEDTLFTMWDRLRCYARKPWVREAVILSAILLLKTSLFLAYRTARREGIEIINL